MGYAFISYSSKKQASADAIRELFKKNDIDSWMAPYDIPAGSSYMGEIKRALADCSCLVLVLSDAAQNSQWVLREVERALSYKKTIIPVKIEDVILNDEFDFALGSCHVVAIKKIDESSDEVKNILKSVADYTGVNTADGDKDTEEEKPKISDIKSSTDWIPIRKPVSPQTNHNYEKSSEVASGFTAIAKEIRGSEIKQFHSKGFAVLQELKKLPSDAFAPYDILLFSQLLTKNKRQLKNAKEYIAEAPHLTLTVALIDTTIFKSGKEGFLFTDERMYCLKNKTRFSVKFKEIEYATANSRNLCIKYTDGTTEKYPICEERIAKLLNAISAAVKK